MHRSNVLLVDATINLVLGALLIVFPRGVADALGVPIPASAFYPSVLGGVLLGIGIALAIQWNGPTEGFVGLGLGGAIAINLCGGAVLAAWLTFGRLELPVRGYVFLWSLAIVLMAISTIEFFVARRRRREPHRPR